jgi:hypothetical protein
MMSAVSTIKTPTEFTLAKEKQSFWNTFAHYQILIPQIIPTSSWEKTKITKLGDDFWRQSHPEFSQCLSRKSTKIQYENVPFPNLPKDKVVGLVTIKPKKKAFF